jgi:hypothetical protein
MRDGLALCVDMLEFYPEAATCVKVEQLEEMLAALRPFSSQRATNNIIEYAEAVSDLPLSI